MYMCSAAENIMAKFYICLLNLNILQDSLPKNRCRGAFIELAVTLHLNNNKDTRSPLRRYTLKTTRAPDQTQWTNRK